MPLVMTLKLKVQTCKMTLLWVFQTNIWWYSFGRGMRIPPMRGKGKEHFFVLLFMIKQEQENHFQNKHFCFLVLAP